MTRRTSDKYGVVFTVAGDDSCDAQEENCITFRDPNLTESCSRTGQDGSDSPDSFPSPIHWRDSHEFSKNHEKQRETREKCLCCLFCFFMLSTASLTALILLLYTGHFRITDHLHKSSRNGAAGSASFNVTYVGEGLAKTVPQLCSTPECIQSAGSILARMDLTEEPCKNFYNFACGGFIRQKRLTWNKTRIREIPDDLTERYEKYLIDKLSSGHQGSDSPAHHALKTVFKSCVSRPRGLDDVTMTTITQLLKSMGGLHLTNKTRDSTFDMTSLLANVTRLYEATPFFKVLVHGPGKISLINRYSDRMLQLLRSLNDDVRSFQFMIPSDFIPRYAQKNKLSSLKTLLWAVFSMLTGTQGSAVARRAVEEVFYFQLELQKVLYDTDIDLSDDDVTKCHRGHRSPIKYLETHFRGYQIRWSDFLSQVMVGAGTTPVTICHIHLSAALQDLLANTPVYIVKRYIVMHTILNTRIFTELPQTKTIRHQLGVFGHVSTKAETVEQQCLHTLTSLLPNSVLCDTTPAKLAHAHYIMETLFFSIKRSLSETFSVLFGIATEQTFRIANETVSSVSRKWMSVALVKYSDVKLDSNQKYLCFLSSYLELVKLRAQRYMRGEITRPYDPIIPSVMGTLAECKDFGFPHGGVWFPSPTPSFIHYSSLGSYIARDVADKLDIQVLLDHYADDVLNDSAVLYLAIRLQCLVDLYNQFELLRQGNTVFKVRGTAAKNENWKDHLALKMAYENFRHDKQSQRLEVIIPGLKYSTDQVFYILYAQTMCEKVSKRGLIEHYINEDSQLSPPGKFRVQGALMNFRPFAKTFKCPPDSLMNPTDKCQIF